MSRIDLALVTLAVGLVACGKGKDKAEPAPTPPAPAPAPAPVAPTTSPAPPPDPFARGSCEYTVDGGETRKGGGGISNVMSTHWMPPRQPGRSIAVPLLINCGPAGNQLSISTDGDTTAVPMGPKKYPIGAGKDFTAMGLDFMSGDGSLDITAWDTTHVAGTFEISAKGKTYKGAFDFKCPQPGNGVCQ